MQNAERKRRLLGHHDYEAIQPLVAIVKCVAGIVALAIIAGGPWLMLNSEAARTAPGQPATLAAKASPDSAVAQSKRVFDERRQRFQARRPGATPETAQSSSAALSNRD